MTEEQLVDIVSRVSPAAAAELHRRGASTVFVDVADMSGWDAGQLAWIASELPRRVGAELEKAGFKLSRNFAAQDAPPPGTNTYVPLVKRFDLRPAPDLVVVLSVSLTSMPGTGTICVQTLSEFLNFKPCDQPQSFNVNPVMHHADPHPAQRNDTFGPAREVSKMEANAVADLNINNKQVLADTFRNLVRYALLKTHRDVVKLGVTPSSFSVEAINSSLAACANAGIFKASAPSLKTLLEKAKEPSLMFHGCTHAEADGVMKVERVPLTFHFYWEAPNLGEPLEAAFALAYEPHGDLEVTLLWLALPERIPISPRIGALGGLKPLEEAVQELVRVLGDGRLAPYPPPE